MRETAGIDPLIKKPLQILARDILKNAFQILGFYVLELVGICIMANGSPKGIITQHLLQHIQDQSTLGINIRIEKIHI